MVNKKIDDISLVGGGIMSLTLATLIHEINSNVTINLYEKLSQCGQESSSALNNAGTGHAGYCELNYTPMDNEGNIKVDRALEINNMFEVSLQFWAYLENKYSFFDTKKFLKKTPHISFVHGEKNTDFLKKRFSLLSKEPLFKGMEFTDNPKTIKTWSPLLMEGRPTQQIIAATKVEHGTDINFGELVNQLLCVLKTNKNFNLHLNHDVTKVSLIKNNQWLINTKSLLNQKSRKVATDFLFIGAGGKAINILHDIKIDEIRGYGGFPISGKWLVCSRQKVVTQHRTKVYSQAAAKAPPMSVPHLDLRAIDGKETLLFGPFAGFTLKFLKQSSRLDFFKSIRTHNITSLMAVFISNLNLLTYLIRQSFMSHSKRMEELRNFYPAAKNEDWQLLEAGQRVQIIKNCDQKFGKLEFGTEVVLSKNKRLAALLGASPGASVAVSSMARILTQTDDSNNLTLRLRKIIPSYDIDLNKNPVLLKKLRTKLYRQLGLE